MTCLWLLVAILLTFVINLPTLRGMVSGHGSETAIVLSTANEDEARYLSRVREVVDGYPMMGNPILKEHRSDVTINGLIEWLTAGWMRAMRVDLPMAVAQTDVVLPLINLFLMLLWIHAILRRRLLTLAVLALIWIDLLGLGGALLRESHPKSTMLLVNLYLCLVFLPAEEKSMIRIARGILLGLMVYSYPYHWTVLLPFEVLLLLHPHPQPLPPRGEGAFLSWRHLLKKSASVLVPFALTVLPFVIITLRAAARDPVAWDDTLARFGMLSTHGIAAPILQLQLWAVLIAMIAARVVLGARDRNFTFVLLLLAASLVALNSNLLTGKESEFQGHYSRFVLMFQFVALFLLGIAVVPQKLLQGVALIIIGVACVMQIRELPNTLAQTKNIQDEFAGSDERAVLTWLTQHAPKDSVILAPNRLAMLIPVFTSDEVFMSKGARFFVARDEEIVRRYLVFTAFFPEEIDSVDGGTLSVFGNYGGAAYARAKRWYQLTHPLGGAYPKTLPDFIRHQDLRRKVEERVRRPDLREVRKDIDAFELDVLVTTHALPEALRNVFRLEEKVGVWTIYRHLSGAPPSPP